MLKKILSQLTGQSERPQFDASVFQDPIAMKTSWLPQAGGGSNFKSSGLHKVNEQRMEFRPSPMMKIFAGIFVVFGLVLTTVFFLNQSDNKEGYIPFVFSSMFALIGAGMYYYACTPIVFDLGHGYFCRSRKKPELMMDTSKLKRYAELKRVHALQIIAELCQSKNSSYYSYELNLVLEDGSRLNVVDHGNQTALRADAQTLSQFLNKPLWDAS